jgi:hypothetical protein
MTYHLLLEGLDPGPPQRCLFARLSRPGLQRLDDRGACAGRLPDERTTLINRTISFDKAADTLTYRCDETFMLSRLFSASSASKRRCDALSLRERFST